ncbi:hypothetical protein ABH892_001134 [Paenibacillus sp. RC254]
MDSCIILLVVCSDGDEFNTELGELLLHMGKCCWGGDSLCVHMCPLRERIILPIAVASRFLIYTLKGRNPEAKANATASSERFRPLRCFL